MVVSLHKMTAGHGVDYLMSTVVVGGGDRDLGTPLTRYYTEAGTPPGTWLGTGLPDIGSDELGRVVAGDVVTEMQMRLLFEEGRDPITGMQLGKANGAYVRPPRNRRAWPGANATADAATGRDATVDPDDRTATQHPSRAPRARKAVGGFEFTFSPPKSVSALWAVADAGTQSLIADAHHEAMRAVIDLLERRVAMTRLGTDGVARVAVRGVVATAFDHYDSRAGDPQLHTHVIIANRVLGPDGKWRTLYGNPIHKAAVALSDTYDAILMDRIRTTLGLDWTPVDRGRDRNPGWEIDGVPAELLEAFSSRSSDIEVRKDELIRDYATKHGRQPSGAIVVRLRERATLETRQAKVVRSLADLTHQWRARADAVLGADATTWARALVAAGAASAVLRGDDLDPSTVDDLAAITLMAVGERRTVWGRWNLWADAARQTKGVRFATAADREAVLDRIVTLAEERSVRLTPDYDRLSPGAFRLPDGSSAFSPHQEVAYSSQALLDAEARLLAAAGANSAPHLRRETIDRFTLLPDAHGRTLADDQAIAVTRIATSGRAVDVLVGPAGAGKTTALAALRTAWESAAGRGSVIGLAPSAAAAEVLGDALGIRTENTAKWDYEHAAGRWDFQRNQLVLVDEASLAGTLLLDRLVAHAREAGAKVVLVGDWAQLSAVESGGAFGLVARSIEDAPELTDVQRFRHDWEKTATLGLRHGDASVLGSYLAHERLHGASSPDKALESAYRAWVADRDAGLVSVLIAADAETVATLGERARADRVADGLVEAAGIALRDGNRAGVGDEIVIRQNDGRLASGRGHWVKNGDHWTVTQRFDDGSLTVRRLNRDGSVGGGVVLPAEYVAEHVELGYATTVHRAQGLTVDTAHLLIDPETATRELLYVGMTRGASANHVYVGRESVDPEHPHRDTPAESPLEALAEVMARVGAEQSATETLRLAADAHASIATLANEYETIAAHMVSIGAAVWPSTIGMAGRRILGSIAMPTGRNIPTDYADALEQRRALIEAGVARAADLAARSHEPWTREVPWSAMKQTVLYRLRYGIDDRQDPLGVPSQVISSAQSATANGCAKSSPTTAPSSSGRGRRRQRSGGTASGGEGPAARPFATRKLNVKIGTFPLLFWHAPQSPRS